MSNFWWTERSKTLTAYRAAVFVAKGYQTGCWLKVKHGRLMLTTLPTQDFDVTYALFENAVKRLTSKNRVTSCN